MRHPTHRGLLFCILALWMQLLAPVLTLPMQAAVDPFSAICSHSPPGQDVPGRDEHRHDYGHCLLCQATLHSPSIDGRVPDIVPPRPLPRRPMRRPDLARAPPGQARQRPQPRGPPSVL